MITVDGKPLVLVQRVCDGCGETVFALSGDVEPIYCSECDPEGDLNSEACADE